MKCSKNDITGDSLISKTNNKAFEEGYDKIFKEKSTLCTESKSVQKRLETQKYPERKAHQWVLGSEGYFKEGTKEKDPF